MKPFVKIQTPQRELSQVQDQISEAFQSLVKNPLINGVLVTAALTTGTNQVAHTLNRKLQGWIIVRRDNASTVYDSQDSEPDPDLFLQLVASADVNVTLYVF